MDSLFSCAASDDVYTMTKLINGGANVNKCNQNNETPLHVAVIHGSLKAAKCLVSSGANANVKTSLFEESPLHFAVQQGNQALCVLLFDAGADPNIKNCDNEGPVFSAVRWSNADIIPLLSERGSNLNDVNNLGQTPLAVATHFQSRTLVQALLDCGVTQDVSGVPQEALKPLTEQFPKTNTVENLSKPMTANSNRKRRKGFRVADAEQSCLFDIVADNQVNELKAKMKEGIKVNCPASFNNETLLHVATLYGATECVVALLRAGAAIDAKTEFDKETALHIAIREGFFDIFHTLLRNGADIEAENCDGETPIFTAVKSNRTEMFRALTRKNADVNHQNMCSLSPIHFAVLASNKFMIQALLYYGAKFENQSFNPYMFSFKAQDIEIANIIQKEAPSLAKDTCLPKNIFSIIREKNTNELSALIAKGFKLDLVDNLEGSPLHCAIRNDSVECMKLLISKGADVNVLDVQNRETPLMTAINCSTETLNELMNNPEVDYVSVKNKDGETSLFYAVRSNKKDLVLELIQRGADVNAMNNCGLTPLFVAASLRNYEIAQILIDNGSDPLIELHPTLKLANEMHDEKLINMLSVTPIRPVSTRNARCEARKIRSTGRAASPPRGTRSMTSTQERMENSTKCAEGSCIVCQRNKATQKLIPCGHVIACRGCIKQFIEGQVPCPICGLRFYATKTICDE